MFEYESIGAKVRKMRLAKGWTQAVLAARAGIDQKTVSNIERGGGTYSSVSVGILDAVADALGSDLWVILSPYSDSLIGDANFPTVVSNYARSPASGRTAIIQVSEMAAHYEQR